MERARRIAGSAHVDGAAMTTSPSPGQSEAMLLACAAELAEFFYPANPPYLSKEAMAQDMTLVLARHFNAALNASAAPGVGDAQRTIILDEGSLVVTQKASLKLWIVRSDPQELEKLIYDQDGIFIARVYAGNEYYAQLIASSPDLLSAAQAALNFIENTESELGIFLDSGNALRAAITRATDIGTVP